MKSLLQKDIDKTLTDLIELLSSVDEEKINVIPFEGSWTVGQLAQHMIMSNSGFVELINGPSKKTERNPEELVNKIEATFLNFTIKFESPDFIKPPKIRYDKENLLLSLNNIKKQLIQAIETADLTKTCISFELPVLGHVTGLEAIHFVLSHTQRHIHQLKKIINKLATSNNVLTI